MKAPSEKRARTRKTLVLLKILSQLGDLDISCYVKDKTTGNITAIIVELDPPINFDMSDEESDKK